MCVWLSEREVANMRKERYKQRYPQRLRIRRRRTEEVEILFVFRKIRKSPFIRNSECAFIQSRRQL